MSADRELEKTRSAAYASMGLSVPDLDYAAHVRRVMQDAGLDPWDLITREYATDASGKERVILATWDDDFLPGKLLLVPFGTGDDAIRRMVQDMTGTAMTATGRTYRHAATGETINRLKEMVSSATGASGSANDQDNDGKPAHGSACMLFGRVINFNPDGSVTWSKA